MIAKSDEEKIIGIKVDLPNPLWYPFLVVAAFAFAMTLTVCVLVSRGGGDSQSSLRKEYLEMIEIRDNHVKHMNYLQSLQKDKEWGDAFRELQTMNNKIGELKTKLNYAPEGG